MFESVLIANRGEIACRIIATCRRLGIRAVAVYSEADRGAAFVRSADAAYPIGRPEPEHSYLRPEVILAAAKAAGVQAVHPGYGFLAENAEFALACATSGLTFIGPPPDAIRAMGLKHEAKARMESAGVRVLPGYRGEAQEPRRLAEAAAQVGYPVLIKAVAGGGGKGMRRVDHASEFAHALESAQREALNAFRDARVLIEKYLARARHIEVQVFADRHGNVVHLFERDCSLQRRHQKILEEAPAPGTTPSFERALCDLALRATRAIAYEGAGTIELIADVADGLAEERVYFMEMNTRLQVEHPVTELITGVDLVEWQLRVAAGEPLPREQAGIERRGHAIEVRLYAEDPARHDLPQTGRLAHLALPETSGGVRVDTGVATGDEVSVYYDGLLAKIAVWGADRASAVRRLRSALDQVEVAGVLTNVTLLSAIARHPAFAAGDIHTGFLSEHATTLRAHDPVREEELWVLACIGRLEGRRARGAGDPSPWADTRAFRLNGAHTDELTFAREGRPVTIPVTFAGSDIALTLPSRTVSVRHARLEGVRISCELDGRRLRGIYLEVEARAGAGERNDAAGRSFAFAGGLALELAAWPSPLAIEEEGGGSNVIKAPMPGKIHAVLVAAGARVRRGQPLLSLEAMKMEHTLGAPRAGEVEALYAQVGEQVEEGRTLLVLRGEEA